ncbi:MAG: hypothetical protein LBB68_01140 [Treponema sp.]|jgi:hypothetical protein|nr:hypothetical protein [Treponema sp.]
MMGENKFFVYGMAAFALALVLSVVSCQTTSDPILSETLGSLLRLAPSKVETWDKGGEKERDVTEYSFNPAIKDELMQALEDAGFVQSGSGEYTRDWDLERGVLRWYVPADTERWDRELQFSALGEATVHTYGFKPNPNSGGPKTPSGQPLSGTLDSLLRVAPSEVQKWDEGGEDERGVTVYTFNPAIKDVLMQAVKDAGFYQAWSAEHTRDWDLGRGVLHWCVPADTEKWDREIQFSKGDETKVYYYGFKPIPAIPNSDGVPKTIKVTGYNAEGGEVYSMQIFSEQPDPAGWRPPAAVALDEIDGQTITCKLGIWMYRWEDLESWTGTGKFFIGIEYDIPRDPSKDGSKYVYSPDGTNPAPVDIKDEVTTLEWSKFIWLTDYTAG